MGGIAGMPVADPLIGAAYTDYPTTPMGGTTGMALDQPLAAARIRIMLLRLWVEPLAGFGPTKRAVGSFQSSRGGICASRTQRCWL